MNPRHSIDGPGYQCMLQAVADMRPGMLTEGPDLVLQLSDTDLMDQILRAHSQSPWHKQTMTLSRNEEYESTV